MERTKIWVVEDSSLREMASCTLDYEKRLHEWIKKDISILGSNLLLLGSKVKLNGAEELDLLAIDNEGDLVVIELKKNKTPRDVVAQVLDYASSVAALGEDELDVVVQKQHGESANLQELMEKRFGIYADIEINLRQKIIIVASAIDSSVQRVVKYLAKNGLDINVMFFSFYRERDMEFLARNMLVEESDVESGARKGRRRDVRFITSLFETGKLDIGKRVFYGPAKENTGEKNEAAYAEVVNKSSKCLSYGDALFSFSGLRRHLIKELKIGLDPDWGFNMRNEWFLEKDDGAVRLSDL